MVIFPTLRRKKMKGTHMKENINKMYKSDSDVFKIYLEAYHNNPIPYDEFLLVYKKDLVGELVYLPYYS